MRGNDNGWLQKLDRGGAIPADPATEDSFMEGASGANRREPKFMSYDVSREVWIDPASYEDYWECLPGLKYLRMLGPDTQAKSAILMAVRHLYWTTDIPVAEIRDAYAPGMPISAVVTMAGPARLNIVCRRCSVALYVTSC